MHACMAPFPLFLFSLLLLLQVTSTHKTNLDDEKLALLRFINNLTHDESYNWNARNTESPCSWKGVLCDPNNITVIQLSMPSAGLTGPIQPQTLANLPSLLVLTLNNNNLNGTIPYDFQSLTLNELYLQDNNFSGDLSYINTDELESLNVSNNDFNCSITWSLYDKFPNQSAVFSGNDKLCLHHWLYALFLCNITEADCPLQYSNWQEYKIRRIKTKATFGLSVGFGLPLLLFVCWLPRKINQPRKAVPGHVPSVPAALDYSGGAGTTVEGEGNKEKLVFLDDLVSGFDYEDLLTASGEVLGKGSFGTSYKAVLDKAEMTVFLKRLIKGVCVMSETEFESRMEVLGKMKSEYVVALKGYCYTDREKLLVYDYVHAGSLYARLHGQRGLSETQLNSNHRMKIALSASKGMAYLHDNNVVHGNIKSSNVLFQQENNTDVIMSDYGLYTLFNKWNSPNHQVVSYWAPEVLKTQNFSFQSDVYSFGVLLLELLTGKTPNNQASGGWNDFPMWIQLVVSEQPNIEIFDLELRMDQNINEMFQMLQIAKDCVSIVPNHRPTMERVVSMLNEIIQDEVDHSFGRPIIGL